MTNQTLEKDENNRGENKKTNLENELRSSWLKRRDLFQTFDEDLKADLAEIIMLLDESTMEESQRGHAYNSSYSRKLSR